MKLTVLGSGTVAPSADRTSPAHWLETGGARLLLDCGAGMLHRAAAFGIPWWETTHVALSHFHQDHFGELAAFLFAQRWGTDPPRTTPLVLIGPRGFRERLGHLAQAFGAWLLEPDTFEQEIVELAPGARYELVSDVTLECTKTPHTDESLAYAIRDREVHLVYTGDTGPSEALGRWAAGCDLLLAECSLPDERAMDIHLTPASVGELARMAQPGLLVLTHCYPVFGTRDPAQLVRETYPGTVAAAKDGSVFEIP